jgi:hypothetical protein
MLGPAKPRRLDQPIAVSLEDLVPQDHFYRHLEATLDLSFVRDWTRELYAERGRPGIDPVIFFKLQLIMLGPNNASDVSRETCHASEVPSSPVPVSGGASRDPPRSRAG